MTSDNAFNQGTFFEGKLLIVDDEPDILKMLSDLGEQAMMKVYAVGNGAQALDLLSQHKFDVILSDLVMPALDGIELLRIIRARNISTPFIFVTGNPSDRLNLEALQLGAFDCVEKPFDSERIVNLIMDAAQQQRSMTRVDRSITDLMAKNPGRKIDKKAVQNVMEIGLNRSKKEEEVDIDQFVKFAYFSELDDVFVSETLPLLDECESTLENILLSKKPSYEIASLFRIMRMIKEAAESIGASKIAKTANALEDACAYYRVNTSVLSKKRLMVLMEAYQNLRRLVLELKAHTNATNKKAS